MNESCFRSFVTTPIKNLLRVKKLKTLKWMNPRPPKNQAYVPTLIEHVANVVTHGILIVPSLVGALELVMRSSTWSQLISAFVYGVSLLLLFTISTFFHGVHYCRHDGSLKVALHRCDRAMIYVFIAASYFPWLTVENYPDDTVLVVMRMTIWVMASLGILYQQIFHERYKMLEIIFYVVMGVGPAIPIYHIKELSEITELKLGGLIYILGIIFFKSDGRIPCAHAIWHVFVAVAAGFHYYAILNNLYPVNGDRKSSNFNLLPGVMQNARAEIL